MLFKFAAVAFILAGQCFASAIHNVEQPQSLLANGDIGILGCTDAGRDNPNCVWCGTAPWCSSGCPGGTVQRGWDACGVGKCCVVGMKRLCCPSYMANEEATPPKEPEAETVVEHYEITIEKTVESPTESSIQADSENKCVVAGFAPFCRGECPDGYKKKAQDKCLGPGPCCITGSKALCCTE
ncbi:hypothetical protein P170DRAFT_514631 [Aspergillus steynii IBT 23096]|uniref:Uncharacterized protein n=1 Tax=Aspergillus steynii IBT 23096 TaxID=1392250 RepID=A0A2I2FS11_9EURO|nr:uncharacterized protein P170DRAFT_514631 [Aspergillus steynii IBT 23096]PLB43411.1 hypothetical protein P170DRAFT_514631 [Aspergillus steynii IBT 23096]